MRERARPSILVGVLFSLLVACGSPDDANPTIDVLDDHFSPDKITVAVGTTVYWSWNGQNEHNVVFAEAGGEIASEVQIAGGFDRTFATPGTYPYQCWVHPGMNGTITVR